MYLDISEETKNKLKALIDETVLNNVELILKDENLITKLIQESLKGSIKAIIAEILQNKEYRNILRDKIMEKLKKDIGPIPVSCTADIIQAARTAVGMDSPLSAEQFLYEYRLSVLSNLQPLDIFSMDAVYAYGIKLLLVQRMKMFNREKGTDSYHKIYDTILGETI